VLVFGTYNHNDIVQILLIENIGSKVTQCYDILSDSNKNSQIASNLDVHVT
jgi:hypothetical protein